MGVKAMSTAVNGKRSRWLPISLMSIITAAGITAAGLLARFQSADTAVFAICFVMAFIFVLLVFVSEDTSKSRSRNLLANTLAWVFSSMMVLALGALGSSYFMCWPSPMASYCETPSWVLEYRRVVNDNARLEKQIVEMKTQAAQILIAVNSAVDPQKGITHIADETVGLKGWVDAAMQGDKKQGENLITQLTQSIPNEARTIRDGLKSAVPALQGFSQ